MKKISYKRIWVILMLLAVIGLTFSCDFLPMSGEKGTLTISMPGASNDSGRSLLKYLPDGILDKMGYSIAFAGPSKRPTIIAFAGETVTVELEPGRWTISVTAYFVTENSYEKPTNFDGETKAGSAVRTIDVYTGRQNQMTVPVAVLEDFLAPGYRDIPQRLWAPLLNDYDAVYASAEPVFYYWTDTPPCDIEYMWYRYVNDINNTSAKEKVGCTDYSYTLPASDKQIERPVYYYCDITYHYSGKNDSDDSFTRTVSSPPAGIYPVSAAGLQARIDDTFHDEIINLPGDEDLAKIGRDLSMDSTITVKKNAHLRANQYTGNTTIKRGPSLTGSLFRVNRGATLTLDSWVDYMVLTIDGSAGATAPPQPFEASLFIVEGTLIVDNVNLRGNKTINGGAVSVIEGGKFIMNGGAIRSNFAEVVTGMLQDNVSCGGGVFVSGKGSSFIMNGGIIGGEVDNVPVGNEALYGGAVYVDNGAFFTMNAEAVIQNNSTGSNNGGSGGGVFITGVDSVFTMNYGALIDGNDSEYGGGIGVYDGAKFILNGGQITGNTAALLGGGVFINGIGLKAINEKNILSSFVMNDESYISHNVSNEYGGGVALDSGASFTMNGGAIAVNNASYGGGVHAGGSLPFDLSPAIPTTFTMNGGIIGHIDDIEFGNSSEEGGGVSVCNGAKFIFKKGDIAWNFTTENGGGVLVDNAVFTMSGGNICDNESQMDGGGIYVQNNSFCTISGGNVTRNLTEGDGGGIYVHSYATCTIDGGNVTWNEARRGGGVCVETTSSTTGLFLKKGSIAWNKAIDGHGGGVHVITYGDFTMSGGEIKGNSALKSDGTTDCLGGGVYYSGGNNQPFVKTGGTLYGANGGANANLCDGNGKAVFAAGRYINDTVGSSVVLWIDSGGPGEKDKGDWQ